jgi:hypothetical protein
MGNYSDNYGYFYLLFVLLETTRNHRVVFSHYFLKEISRKLRVFSTYFSFVSCFFEHDTHCLTKCLTKKRSATSDNGFIFKKIDKD